MKKVVVTGGNGDIAQAICDELISRRGFEVYTPGRDEMDVTNISDVKNFIDQVQPDILINNAGHIKPVAISENEIFSDKRTIDVNLLGVFICTGAVLEKNNQALIINIGSSAGTKDRGYWSSYCATKAAVIMATKCWAKEGVKAICISPGRTATKMRKTLCPNEDQSTLLSPNDFAKIVIKAIDGEYRYGDNIDVNIQNIKELLND